MISIVDYHPAVRDEIDEAYIWYENRANGLGSQFLDEIEQVIQLIRTNPFRFGFALKNIREGLLNRFPFAIYYRVQNDKIRIISIHHTAKDPNSWAGRN